MYAAATLGRGHMPLPCRLPVALSAAALTLGLLTLACSGNDGPTTSAPNSTGSPANRPSAAPTQQRSPTAGAPPSPTVAPPTRAPGSPQAAGTPAVGPADPTNYISQDYTQEDCQYNPGTDIVACPGRGAFTINPPFLGEDISCTVFIVQEKPVLLLCRSQQPQQAVYYAIQRTTP